MKSPYRLIVLILLLAGGCSSEPEDVAEAREDLPKSKIEELLVHAQEQVTIATNKIEFNVELYRDFMPISPPEGGPLESVNYVFDIDSTVISNTIEMIEQYVIYQDSLWTAPYSLKNIVPQPHILFGVSIGGPKWGPEVEVTVVIKIRDSSTGLEYYLIRRNQLIQRGG